VRRCRELNWWWWSGFCRTSTVPDRLSYSVEVCDRDETACAVERVAGLVPVRVVFSSHDVEEVALRKAEVARLWVGVGGRVVVEGFYDL
jgi:hypothetical protein